MQIDEGMRLKSCRAKLSNSKTLSSAIKRGISGTGLEIVAVGEGGDGRWCGMGGRTHFYQAACNQ